MSTPFLAEIRLCSFNFPPKGWAFCNGQLLSINQNQALFSLLGTTYGGNGTTTFQLPDLRDRIPVHFGASIALGQQGGAASHTLSNAETAHNHDMKAFDGLGTSATPDNNFIATPVLGATAIKAFSPGYDTTLASSSESEGSSAAHTNLMPYLTLNFIIALSGIFPSRP